ncbi:MAG: hypothetical protein QXS02_00065 [Candidatus Thermoplasmatota archaeon]
MPTGRFYIKGIDAPDTVKTGENFTVVVSVKNDKLLPTRGVVKINLLSGLLETMQKDIGVTEERIFEGKTTTYLTINCVIREGDTNWYKEVYNIEAVLVQRLPIIGWVIRDTSTIKGLHIVSPLCEKDKIQLICLESPELLDEGKDSFETLVHVKNSGLISFPVWVRVDIVEKASVLPELEQYNILQGFASERKEIGRSDERIIPAGSTESFRIQCYLREADLMKKQFMIQAVLYVNVNGSQYQVDTSTFQSIIREESFIKKYSIEIVIGVFLFLIGLLIIVLIIRIIYPAYVVKRIKVQEERRRVEKQKRRL